MSFLSYTKNFNDNLLMFLLRDPKRYMPIVEFFDKSTQDLSELTQAEAELVAAEVSEDNHSEFCNGIRKGMISALQTDPIALKSEKFMSVLNFARKLNQDSSSITQSDIQAVRDAGWSEQTVEDTVGLVAIQNLYNIIANGLGFKGLSEAVFAEIAQDTVHKGGYATSFRSFIIQPEEPLST